MKDTQSQLGHRGIAIDLVGVSGLCWPMDRQFERQALNEKRGEITFKMLPRFVAQLHQRLAAVLAEVEDIHNHAVFGEVEWRR